VWSSRNKSYLIDTILEKLPIPELYIQLKTYNTGKTDHIVVDGQQRIRSILEFIEGKLILDEEESVNHPKCKFQDLSDGERTDFFKYELVTRHLQTDNDKEIQNVFKRLNRYVISLNDQELRNATYSGHFIKMVNKIAEEDEFWRVNKIVTATDVKRMIDAEFISELFIAMLHGIQPKEQDNITGFYNQYDQNFPNREKIKQEFEATKKLIQKAFCNDIIKTRWHKKSDFYSLFIAFNELQKSYYFPPENCKKIKDRLIKFSSEVDIMGKAGKKPKNLTDDPNVKVYTGYVNRATSHKTSREKRYEIIRGLIIPYLIAKDPRHNFNEEERRIAWALSKDKKCGICGEKVAWEDYQLDHKYPGSKGGNTELINAQISHRNCNIRKSNKV
jgi:hypothetical protein